MEYRRQFHFILVFIFFVQCAFDHQECAARVAKDQSSAPYSSGYQHYSLYPDLIPDLNAIGFNLDGAGGYFNFSNDHQGLSWGESYVLISYLNAFEATMDPIWLNLFVKHADAVINHRDDRANRYQKYPVWSTKVPSLQGNAYGLTVDSGMITWPLARFAFMNQQYGLDRRIPSTVRKNYPYLAPYTGFQEMANRYAGYAEETLQWHIRREYYESLSSLRFPFFPYNSIYATQSGVRGFFKPREETASFLFDTKGRPNATENQLPYNMENSLGITSAYLYGVTHHSQYLRVARGLFRNYLDVLFPVSSSAYYVDYWGIENSVEDASHGWMNAEFLRAAHETGIGVNTSVIQTYGRIASKKLYGSSGDVFYFFNQDPGKKNDMDSYRVFGTWSTLNPYDPDISPLAYSIYKRKKQILPANDVIVFNTLSSILRNSGSLSYSASCSMDSQCQSGICFGLNRNQLTGICGQRLGFGSSCNRHLECASGVCLNGQCMSGLKSDGNQCSQHLECASARCVSGFCRSTEARSTGASCISNLDCGSSLCVSGTCRVKFALGNGSSCSKNEECASLDCYDNRVCQTRLGNGSNCKVDNDCYSGVCFKNQVCASKLGVGSVCYRHQECLSHHCPLIANPPQGQYWRPWGVCMP